MKLQSVDPNPTAKCGSKPGATELSNEAFYLIAIALLLKKESGNASLYHYLVPGAKPVKKEKLCN